MTNISVTQLKVLTFTPCVSGFLSILGSAAIFCSIFINRESRLCKTYHRLVLSVAVMDIISTVGNGMSTFPAPSGIPGVYAFGNMWTCELQGFLVNLGISVPLYTLMLSVYYVLTICYNMKENAMHKIEPWFHIVASGISFGGATVALVLKLYNFQGNKCTMTPYPPGCAESEDVQCTRGANAYLLSQLLAGVPLYLSLVGVAACMIHVYWTLRSRELAAGQYSFRRQLRGNQSRTERERRAKHSLSKKMAEQGVLYVGALFLTYIWTIILHAVKAATGEIPFPLLLLSQIFVPLQGLFNFIIYIRPYVNNIKTSDPDCTNLHAIILAIFSKPDERSSDQSSKVRLSDIFKRRTGLIRQAFKRNLDDKRPLDV